jgi:hypothetical protein
LVADLCISFATGEAATPAPHAAKPAQKLLVDAGSQQVVRASRYADGAADATQAQQLFAVDGGGPLRSLRRICAIVPADDPPLTTARACGPMSQTKKAFMGDPTKRAGTLPKAGR